MDIDASMSSMFIVSQGSSLLPMQEGLLIASSGEEDDVLNGVPPQALNSSQPIVRLASRALLSRFSQWSEVAVQHAPENAQENATRNAAQNRTDQSGKGEDPVAQDLHVGDSSFPLFNFSRSRAE